MSIKKNKNGLESLEKATQKAQEEPITEPYGYEEKQELWRRRRDKNVNRIAILSLWGFFILVSVAYVIIFTHNFCAKKSALVERRIVFS